MGDSRSIGTQAPSSSSSSLINENVEDSIPILGRIDSILTDLPEPSAAVTITESRSSLPGPGSDSRISLPRLSQQSASRRPIINGVHTEVERIFRFYGDINVTLHRLDRETNMLAASSSNISNNQDSDYGSSFSRNNFDADVDEFIDLTENNSNTSVDVFIISPHITTNRTISLRSPDSTNNRTISLRSPTSSIGRRSRYEQYTTRTVRFRSRSPRLSSVGTSTNNMDSIPDTRDVVIAKKSIKDNAVTINCPICMENCIHKKPMTTKCGHIFCQICITKIILRRGKCPLCNLKQKTRHLIRVYL